MTLPINNEVYTAAYGGALAGMGVGSRMLSASTGIAQLAGAWASAFDTAWNSAASIDQLQFQAIQSASQAAWSNQNPIVDTTTLSPATYAGQCATIIGQIAAGEAYYTSQGNTPPPYGGGASNPFNPLAIAVAMLFTATLASPGLGQPVLPGSGNATGQATVLFAQPGQNNASGTGGAGGGYVLQGGNGGTSTGAVANSNGGNVTASPGAAGTGGSGAAGNPGYFQASPGGTPAIQLGIIQGDPGTSAVYGSLTPTNSNYYLASDNSSYTALNALSGGVIRFTIAGAPAWQVGFSGSETLLWANLGAPSASNYILSADLGTYNVSLNAPGSGTINFTSGGSTTLWTMSKVSTADGFFAGAAGAPGFTNFALVGSASATILNSPSADLQLAVGGVTAWDVNLLSGNPALGNGVLSSTNYSLQTTGTATVLNGPQGVIFAEAGNALWAMTDVPTTTIPGLFYGGATPSSTNYALASNGTGTIVNATTLLSLAIAGSNGRPL